MNTISSRGGGIFTREMGGPKIDGLFMVRQRMRIREVENALSHLLCVPPSPRPYVCVFVITLAHMRRRFRGVFVANLILCGNIIYGDAITLCEIKVCHGKWRWKKKPCSQILNTESTFGDRCEYVEEEEEEIPPLCVLWRACRCLHDAAEWVRRTSGRSGCLSSQSAHHREK